jgi:TrmH family RNA methyltransferase
MITSTDNPKVKLARSLHERRGRERQGLCLVEGARLIHDAMRAGRTPALVLFQESARRLPGSRSLLEGLAGGHAPVWELTPEAFATVSDTTTSQGILAIVPIPAPQAPLHPTLILVLDRVRDPGNLGTILRSAAAAGVELVMLVQGSADPWSPKALRAGMGAQFRVALRSGVRWSEVAALAAGCGVWAADAGGDAIYDQVNWVQPSALIVGGETEGLSTEAVDLAVGRLAIPMSNEVESLNAAMAATVLLFEAARQRRSGPREERSGETSGT